MKYYSTRGKAPVLGFSDTVLTGLAEDGGLYLPASYPQIDYAALKNCSYQELAFHIIQPFVGDEIPAEDLQAIIGKSYKNFHHPAIAPLKQLSGQHWLLELFHGSTLAFKDYPLQFLGQLFGYLLDKRDSTITILGATSGDTGSAAIHGCMISERVKIFILHPHGRVSDVQRKQMTTVKKDNVHNIAIKGNFDNCQDIVKTAFADLNFRHQMRLSAINSINWARILSQVVYYAYACINLNADKKRPLSFSVPSGNFGNIFAAWVGKQIGLPIDRLIAGSNRNDILARIINQGDMSMREVEPSLSPSMDIQISSNFERLLYELSGRDSNQINNIMAEFRQQKTARLAPELLQGIQRQFSAYKLDDRGITETIGRIFEETGELIDPHTAVGVSAAEHYLKDNTSARVVSLACAHPAKFGEAVKAATGIAPQLPHHLDNILSMEEYYTVLENNVESVKQFIMDS